MEFTTTSGPFQIGIRNLIVAGWTGRDARSVQHHIDELAELGIAPPSQVPLFYRASRGLLTQDHEIDVLGPTSSGEAEPLLIQDRGTLWLGLASDHTDRELEAYSVAASKQACPKPCAPQLWPMEDIAGHLEDLQIRSWIIEDGERVLYQEGTLAQILPLSTLMDGASLSDGDAMLCGTFPAIGGVRPAGQFEATLHDPRLGRDITLSYAARVLPVVV